MKKSKLIQLSVAAAVVGGSVFGGAAAAQAAPVYHGGVYVLKSECNAERQQVLQDRAYRVLTDCEYGQPSDEMVDGYTFYYTPAY
ncbi:hypothetical protein ACWGJ9_09335 [Curtobacterium citreum]